MMMMMMMMTSQLVRQLHTTRSKKRIFLIVRGESDTPTLVVPKPLWPVAIILFAAHPSKTRLDSNSLSHHVERKALESCN